MLTFFARCICSVLACTCLAASAMGLIFILPALYGIWFTDIVDFSGAI